MTYLIVSLAVFFIAVFLHVITHRLFADRGIKSYKTVLVLVFGIIINLFLMLLIAITPSCSLKLPLTGILLNGLLTCLYTAFFTSVYLGDESPASRIVKLVSAKNKMTEKEILNEFSDKILVFKRLDDLVNSGHTEQKGRRYIITKRGFRLNRVINWYRSILRWDWGG